MLLGWRRRELAWSGWCVTASVITSYIASVSHWWDSYSQGGNPASLCIVVPIGVGFIFGAAATALLIVILIANGQGRIVTVLGLLAIATTALTGILLFGPGPMTQVGFLIPPVTTAVLAVLLVIATPLALLGAAKPTTDPQCRDDPPPENVDGSLVGTHSGRWASKVALIALTAAISALLSYGIVLGSNPEVVCS